MLRTATVGRRANAWLFQCCRSLSDLAASAVEKSLFECDNTVSRIPFAEWKTGDEEITTAGKWGHVHANEELINQLNVVTDGRQTFDLSAARQVAHANLFPDREMMDMAPNVSAVWAVPSTNDADSSPHFFWQLGPQLPPRLWIPLGTQPYQSLSTYSAAFEKVHGVNLEKESEYRFQLMNTVPELAEKMEKMSADAKSMVDDLSEVNEQQLEMEFFQKLRPELLTRKLIPFFSEIETSSLRMFMGATNDFVRLEATFMLNPFAYLQPLILSSINEHLKDTSVDIAIFRTIFSRSTVTFEGLKSLKTRNPAAAEDAPEQEAYIFPVFSYTEYPVFRDVDGSSTMLPDSYAVFVESINKDFGYDFPLDMPIDVIAMHMGHNLLGARQLHEMIKHQVASGYDPDPYAISQCALLDDPNFRGLIDELKVRTDNKPLGLALLAGAMHLKLDDCVDELADAFDCEDARQMVQMYRVGENGP